MLLHLLPSSLLIPFILSHLTSASSFTSFSIAVQLLDLPQVILKAYKLQTIPKKRRKTRHRFPPTSTRQTRYGLQESKGMRLRTKRSINEFAGRVVVVGLLNLAEKLIVKGLAPLLKYILLNALIVFGFSSLGIIIGGTAYRISGLFSPAVVYVIRTSTRPPKATGDSNRETIFHFINENLTTLSVLFVVTSLASFLFGYLCLKAKRANDRAIVANAVLMATKRLRKRRAAEAEAAKRRKRTEDLKRRWGRGRGRKDRIPSLSSRIKSNMQTLSTTFFGRKRRRYDNR